MPSRSTARSAISTASSRSCSARASTSSTSRRSSTNDQLFGRLCRVISLTERRGYDRSRSCSTTACAQRPSADQDLPRHRAGRAEPLGAVRRLARRARQRNAKWWERAVDSFVHSELLFLKLPVLFVHPSLKRRTAFADEEDGRGAAVAANRRWRRATDATGAATEGGLGRRLLSRHAANLLARNTIVSCGIFAFDIALLWVLVELGMGQGRGGRARLRRRQFAPLCVRARAGFSAAPTRGCRGLCLFPGQCGHRPGHHHQPCSRR